MRRSSVHINKGLPGWGPDLIDKNIPFLHLNEKASGVKIGWQNGEIPRLPAQRRPQVWRVLTFIIPKLVEFIIVPLF